MRRAISANRAGVNSAPDLVKRAEWPVSQKLGTSVRSIDASEAAAVKSLRIAPHSRRVPTLCLLLSFPFARTESTTDSAALTSMS